MHRGADGLLDLAAGRAHLALGGRGVLQDLVGPFRHRAALPRAKLAIELIELLVLGLQEVIGGFGVAAHVAHLGAQFPDGHAVDVVHLHAFHVAGGDGVQLVVVQHGQLHDLAAAELRCQQLAALRAFQLSGRLHAALREPRRDAQLIQRAQPRVGGGHVVLAVAPFARPPGMSKSDHYEEDEDGLTRAIVAIGYGRSLGAFPGRPMVVS
jgi:hypothetical protein